MSLMISRHLIGQKSRLAGLIVSDVLFICPVRRKVCVKRKISRRIMKLMAYLPLQEEKSLCRLPKQCCSHTQIMLASHFTSIMWCISESNGIFGEKTRIYHEHIRLGMKYQKWSGVSQYDQKLCKAALESLYYEKCYTNKHWPGICIKKVN